MFDPLVPAGLSLSPRMRPESVLRRVLSMIGALLSVGVLAALGACSGDPVGPVFAPVEQVFMSEGQVREVPLSAGLEGDEITFAFEGKTPSFAAFSYKSEGTVLKLAPGFDDAGKYEIKISAAIGDGPKSIRELLVHVADVNRAPVFEAIEALSVREGESEELKIKASDPDGDGFELSLEGRPPRFVALEGDVLIVAPDFGQAGEYRVTVRATDSRNVSSRLHIEITVVEVDRPPVFEPLDEVVMNEGEQKILDIRVEDPDGDPLEVWLDDSAPVFASLIPDPDQDGLDGLLYASLYLLPGSSDSGSYELTFFAQSKEQVSELRVSLTVHDVNHPPTLEPIADVQLQSGEELLVELVANDVDPEDEVLQVVIEGLEPWMELDGLELLLAPPEEVRGFFQLTVRVIDREGEWVEQSFMVHVLAPSHAPIISELEQRLQGESLEAGSHVSQMPLVWVFANDPDGDSLRLEIEVARVGVPFKDEATQTSSYVPGGGSGISLQLPRMRVGQYKWQARVVDVGGSEGDWQPFAEGEVAFILDALPLEGSVTVASSQQGWVRHRSVTLNLNATPVSGASMSRMAFSSDGVSWSLERPWASSTFWQLGPGSDEQVIHAKVRDTFGNEGLFSTPIRVDDLRPEGSLTVLGTVPGRPLVDLELDFADEPGGSGVVDACVANFPSGPWGACITEPGTVEGWELLPSHGEKAVYARIRDLAGNQRILHSSFFFDAKPPELTLLINGGASYTTRRNVKVSADASDESGIDRVCFRFSTVEYYSDCGPPQLRQLELPNVDGSHEIWARAKDNAGNQSDKNATIVLDRSPPAVSLNIPSASEEAGLWMVDEGDLVDGKVELALSASDVTSGVAFMQFSHDGQTWLSPEEPTSTRMWELAPAGELSTLTFRAADRAGNFSAPIIRRLMVRGDGAKGPRLLVNGGKDQTSQLAVRLFVDHHTVGEPEELEIALSNNGEVYDPAIPFSQGMRWTLSSGSAGPREVFARLSTDDQEWKLHAEIEYDPDANPALVVINQGASHSKSPEVELLYQAALPGVDLLQVCASNDGFTSEDCSLPILEADGGHHDWELPDLDAEHTVSLRFEFSDLNELFADASITLQRQALSIDSLLLNQGAEWTNQRWVKVDVDSPDWARVSTVCMGEEPNSLRCQPRTEELYYRLKETGGAERTVLLEIRDAAGNSAQQNATIKYDPVPPEISLVHVWEAGTLFTFDRNVHLHVSASDQGSGLDQMWISFDQGQSWDGPSNFASPKQIVLPAGEDGMRHVWVQVSDKAGNISTGVGETVLDSQPPALELVINEGSGWTQSPIVDLSIVASDLSGLREFCVSNVDYGSNWRNECSPLLVAKDHSGGVKGWDLAEGLGLDPGESLEDGQYTVYLYARDGAAHDGMTSQSVELRTKSPVFTQMLLNSGAEYTRSSQVEVRLEVAEKVDLIAQLRVEFSFDGGANWEPPISLEPTTKTLSFPNQNNGERTLHARISDPANNRSAVKSASIKLDTQPPVGLLFINGGAEETHSEHVELSFDYSDNFEVREYCLRDVLGSAPSEASSCWTDIVANLPYELSAGDGDKRLYAWFRDAAGNVSQPADASIRLKTTPPKWSGFDLEHTKARHRGVELAWKPAVDQGSGVSGYSVGWSSNDRDFTWLPISTSTAVSVEPLSNGRDVYFRVRSYDSASHFSTSPSFKLRPDWPFDFKGRQPTPNRLGAVAQAEVGSVILIAGDAGLLLRSDDQAETFRRMDPMSDDDLLSVELTPSLRAVAGSARGQVLLSRDGGLNWKAEQISTGAIHKVALLRSHGQDDFWLAAGDEGLFAATLRSYSGESWTPLELPAELGSTRLRALAVCPQGRCSPTQPQILALNDEGELIFSGDGGQNFEVVDNPGLAIRDLDWLDSHFVLLSESGLHRLEGEDLVEISTEAAPFALRSLARMGSSFLVIGSDDEEGEVAQFEPSLGSYTSLDLPAGAARIRAAVGFGSTSALVVGDGGSVFSFASGTWTERSTGLREDYLDLAASEKAVWFVHAKGLAKLDKSSGRLSQQELSPASGESWTAIAAAGPGELVVVGDQGSIRRSRDEGKSFLPENSNLSGAAFQAVSCVESGGDSGCIAVGASGAVSVKTGSGAWVGDTGSSGLVLSDVVALSLEGSGSSPVLRSLAAGSDGKVWSFTGTTRTSKDVSPGGEPLYAIAQNDGTLVAAGAGGFIARSSNQGEFWTPASVPAGFGEDLYALGSAGDGIWFAVGQNGSLLLSQDNALTWTQSFSGTREAFFAAGAEGKMLWLSGANGAVLVSDTLGD